MNAHQPPEAIPSARVEFALWFATCIGERLGRSHPPIVDLPALRSLPPGSFGRAWADHLDEHGLKPLDRGMRRQQLHDGVHTLTGYGIDPLGEGEVQMFLLGAKFRPVHLLLMAGIVRGLKQQRRATGEPSRETVRSRLKAAYQRGRTANFDPDGWQPETLWSRSLEDVRAEFGLA
ncbi:MAG: Coq4 family protein [Geitlerinemataceae cyanobacterium]